MSWCSSLAGRVQPRTIKQYITHVQSMHTDMDLPFTACESPLVQRLIRGIKRYHGEKDRKPKQPVTLPVLLDVLQHLVPGTNEYAACCLAYAGLLRCGEFTAKSKGTTFDAGVHLSRRSVQFIPSFENTTHIKLTLPASKTDPFRKGVTITIAGAPGLRSDPVAALKQLFERSPRAGESPLFEDPDGTVMHRGRFIAALRTALIAARYNASNFSSHSFRGGGASSAAAAGFSDYEIQLLGRWRSDAYKLYIEPDPSRVLRLSSLLHWVHPQTAPYEPPVLHGSSSLA